MARKIKTRIIVSVRGEVRPLLSVRQLGNGDLMIAFNPPKNLEVEGRSLPIEEWRISIHTSPSSEGNTFKETYRLHDGGLREVIHHTMAISRGLFCPLIFVSPPMWNYFTVPNFKSNDKICTLGEFDQRLNTLFFGIIVSAADCDLAGKLDHRLNVTSLSFECFTLWIVWTYMPAPSPLSGVTTFVATDQQE